MSNHSLAGSEPGALALADNDAVAARRESFGLIYAAAAWAVAAGVTLLWPNRLTYPLTSDFAAAQAIVAVLLLVGFALNGRLRGVGRWLRTYWPWLVALPILLSIWQVATAKTGIWPQPYFPPPQSIVNAYLTDYPRLAESVWASLSLLGTGIAVGAGLGFISGVATGWSQAVGYWVHPILRYIGPVPATALIPFSLFVFPSIFTAGVFLIALATWFPVTVLTWSGIASVNTAYYDVARTLGADTRYLLLHVAIPSSLPHVFVGVFMGLGQGLSTLVVAEMIGVKAGLGYYLDWAQGFAAYPNLYGGLLLMALLFSVLTTALFRVRDHLLGWQKGVVNW